MRLVFVTQVLDAQDAVLGFVMRWVQALAARVERVRVVALEVGDRTGLPENVDVRVVGRSGTLRRYLRYRGFLSRAFGRDGFDTLLTHMVPRYSTVAAPLARRHGVRHFLWYTHKGVDRRLNKAVTLVEKVFTASPESMRVPTENKVVTGHGIDLEHFAPGPGSIHRPVSGERLLSVGRLSPVKDPVTLVEGLALLRERGMDVHLDWVGGALAEGDEAYGESVCDLAQQRGVKDRLHLLGAIPYASIPQQYQHSTLFVSGSRTGSVDKVVLEAMATGLPVVTCNESITPLLKELGPDAVGLSFPPGDAHAFAQRVETLLGAGSARRAELGEHLRAIVARDHEVESLMDRLVAEMGGEA